MKKFLFLISLVVALGFSGQALAASVTVDGVTWDPEYTLDFSAFASVLHQDIDSLTGEVSGYGAIFSMNGDASFVAAGAELTFQFGGYSQASAVTPTIGIDATIGYTGGWVKLYVDSSAEVNLADPLTLNDGNTKDGDLWLSLTGHSVAGYSLVGTVAGSGLGGIGQLDVDLSATAAGAYFDTNRMLNGADLAFSTTFTDVVDALNANGVGTFKGSTVPEPATMLLFGIGLLGLAGMGRRKA